MLRNQLISLLKKYFKIQELVCPHCYEKFGDDSWQFLNTEILSTLYVLRFLIFKRPITINTWHANGCLSQRGLRCNMCELVKNKTYIYLSAHTQGNAFDFNVEGYTTEQVYEHIRKNINLFEYPIRMEITEGNWNHIDCYQPTHSEHRLIEFKCNKNE